MSIFSFGFAKILMPTGVYCSSFTYLWKKTYVQTTCNWNYYKLHRSIL